MSLLLGDLLRRQALPTGRPERPALIMDDEVWSYRRLDETADRLASLLGLRGTTAPRSLLAGVRRLTARSKA